MKRRLWMVGASTLAVTGCFGAPIGDDEDDGAAWERESPEVVAKPPPAPKNAHRGDGSGQWFAVTRFYVGTTPRQGVESPDAWRGYGYDLDDDDTRADFTNHCQPREGAIADNVFPDAPLGVDNGFGRSLLPALKTVVGSKVADLQDAVNASVEAGDHGLLIHIADLGEAHEYAPLEAFVFEGRKNDAGSWAVASESLLPGQTSIEAAPFSASYTNQDVWVSGDAASAPTIAFSWGFGLERPLRFELHRPILSMQLSGDHETVVQGVIAGILDVEEIAAEGTDFVRAVSPDFCGEADIVRQVIVQAADILLDGRQDPHLTCDGISFGIGFDAVAIPDVDSIAPPVDVAVPCLGASD